MAAGRAAAIVALATALVYAPSDARSVWRATRNAVATPRQTRELTPAYEAGILEPRAVVAAARVIPLGATYYAAAGRNAPERSGDAVYYVIPWAAFNLLPRRATPRADQAQWILSYGADLGSLGLHFRRIVRLGPGVAAAEVAR